MFSGLRLYQRLLDASFPLGNSRIFFHASILASSRRLIFRHPSWRWPERDRGIRCARARVRSVFERPDRNCEGKPEDHDRSSGASMRRIADRGTEAQQYRASGLNLLIAAIVYWNSTYMADAVVHLHAIGEVVPDEWLTHTSPVGWEHIGLSGDFLWDRAAALPVGRRSLNLARRRDAA